ncbi:DegT/DnrJ/EryC1/StrS aminotransferase family protein [Streptomyces sp. NPDC003758]|uniref:DegT/DnrJ/EryC1/StrS family aminotransferase n=1 Tax=Streptomyces cynarae TaxID=2981134 RepID=A0ABY6E1Q4_9ACTN|nr:DegT/DnrJ/EryC1/StrS family aminotransferase [Streptomyces cynarae]UXY19853.1 DegT/DnrJ/EryC1/StrS family aminotransferase [Streptomyces cynarae]
MRGSYSVPYAKRGTILGAAEVAALEDVVASDDALTMGAWRERFEERFARHVGARHALSVTSGTVALELAIHLLDLQPGDEVVVTPQTFQATAQPLLGSPARVRFCDVQPESLNMDPVVLKSLVNERTRAILLVHYGGWSADMDEIMAIARERGITVIEDCAHALGARYDGRRPGSLGDIGCFSFHSAKNISTLGEGGMLTFDRDDWAERIDRLRSNEIDGVLTAVPEPTAPAPELLPWMKFTSGAYERVVSEFRRPGTNATLSEAAAAVGLVQMDRLDTLVARRRAIAARLDEVVAAHPYTRVQRPRPGIQHAQHLYTCFLDGPDGARERLVHGLNSRGVEVQLRYFPLHLLPEWQQRGHGTGECPVAEHLWFHEHVNLPCHPGLSDAQVDHLVNALDEALAEALAPAADAQPVGAARG